VPVPGAALRTDGPYGLVRHPIYAAVILAAVGYTIAMGSWWTVVVLALLIVFFVAKSRWEDRLLREVHGDQWAAWARTTGALLPRRITPP
jgi:protein-S-isoprenylcysteine O-methyltransferase Ste14